MIVQAGSLCVLLVVLIGALLVKSEPGPRSRPTPIFTNQFAVHVPDGPDAAAEIAAKYGFDNYGQHLSHHLGNSQQTTIYHPSRRQAQLSRLFKQPPPPKDAEVNVHPQHHSNQSAERPGLYNHRESQSESVSQ
ncbi:hypothetical protein WN48_07496 [Eufriesea mexicana]|uniref:Peptidase S8 pro-domain domain-containing protein n=1 Tax=Eufriesea mexicana TaxID=516756 RepID=A0A310SLT3_9HYME|nr:hypothetical protein WN48_07496 [Eufriesea mexicana]